MSNLTHTDKDDIRQIVEDVVQNVVQDVVKEVFQESTKDFATKDDLKDLATRNDIVRLERKIGANQDVNIRHHLETKKGIGDLNKEFTAFREGLAQAATAYGR